MERLVLFSTGRASYRLKPQSTAAPRTLLPLSFGSTSKNLPQSFPSFQQNHSFSSKFSSRDNLASLRTPSKRITNASHITLKRFVSSLLHQPYKGFPSTKKTNNNYASYFLYDLAAASNRRRNGTTRTTNRLFSSQAAQVQTQQPSQSSDESPLIIQLTPRCAEVRTIITIRTFIIITTMKYPNIYTLYSLDNAVNITPSLS